MGGFANVLHVGLTVEVQSLDSGFRFNVLGPSQPGHTVVTVGSDFVVLTDADGGSLRIPLYLIKNVQPAQPEASEAA
jgi:hypothetical protein